jgi:hypothetical protein
MPEPITKSVLDADRQWSTPPGPRGVPAAEIALWLDSCEAKLVHPGQVEESLRRAGWYPDSVLAAVGQYRRRFNQHGLGYTALFVATGLAALAAGTAGHLLAAGIYEPVDRDALAGWLTLFVCALPFAVWAHLWAARTDRHDPVAVWSIPRRTLATILLWACGVVGIGRFLIYTAQLIGVIVGASWGQGVSLLAGAVNVGITVTIALPLGLWAHDFLHRFDSEDPTTPVERRRPTATPPPFPTSSTSA